MDIPQNPRHAKSFHEALALSSRRLGFSVTQGCPLRCRHCSVGAAPELHRNKFTDQFTRLVVGQIQSIADAGICSIDFTGGEPTLVSNFVSEVSAAARSHRITCGIVTACHWARTAQQARKTLSRLNDVHHWDISTDIYHIEFVPLSSVERAYKMLKDNGKEPLIRVAHHDPISRDDALLIDQVMKFAERDVTFQPIGPVGRAEQLISYGEADESSWDIGPCPTTGALVQWDGRVSSCCAPASHEMHEHPLWIGNANVVPIADLIQLWRVHPLVQTIRVWGFKPLREWFQNGGLKDFHILRRRVCDTCVGWLRSPELVQYAESKASSLDHRIRLAHILLEEFDEPWLDTLLRSEAAAYLDGGTWPHNAPISQSKKI